MVIADEMSKSQSVTKSVLTSSSSSKLLSSTKPTLVLSKPDKIESPSYSNLDSVTSIAGSLKFANMPKIWSRVEISLENSLLSEEKLNNPPSLSDGMSSEMERDLRYLGCELIQSASILLKLPQVSAATGQILYQRFYYCKSFVRYSFEHCAMACINLASKIEEAPRRVRDVINVFHLLKQLNRLQEKPSLHRRPHPMVVDQKYVAIKNEVIKAERRVLKELGFCVHVKHPHKLIVSYLQALGALEKQSFLQKAWNYMSDSLRSDLFLRYAPEVVACACIHLASLNLSLPLPSIDVDMRMADGSIQPRRYRWWDLFAPQNVCVPGVCRQLLKLYVRRHKPKWEKLETEVSALKHALLEKQAANKVAGEVENTPNPHLAPSVPNNDRKPSGSPRDKGSPTAKRYSDNSRHEKRDKRSSRVSNGVLAEQDAKRRHRDSRSSASPSSSEDDERRRNSVTISSKERRAGEMENHEHDEVRRRQRRNGDAVGVDRRRRDGRRYDEPVLSQSVTTAKLSATSRSPSRSPSPSSQQKSKRTRKRSRSVSRLRREQDRKEREVREALGRYDYDTGINNVGSKRDIRARDRSEFRKR